MAFPRARPAIKLERIKAADQTEFPKAKPLSRSQRVWKRSALLPERKRMAETIATRTFQSLRCSPLGPANTKRKARAPVPNRTRQKASRPLFANEVQMLKSPARSCSVAAEQDSARLELLRQAHVDEASRRVVGEARITDRISTLAGGEGRIFVEDVIATDRKCGAIQEMVPDAHLS